jgi:hypothetical protein
VRYISSVVFFYFLHGQTLIFIELLYQEYELFIDNYIIQDVMFFEDHKFTSCQLYSGHDKEDVAQKEKQSQDQVIKEIWTIIRSTSVKVKSGGDDIGNLLKGIKKYVSDAQIRLVEFNE